MFSVGQCCISDRGIATSRTTAPIGAVDDVQDERVDVVDDVVESISEPKGNEGYRPAVWRLNQPFHFMRPQACERVNGIPRLIGE